MEVIVHGAPVNEKETKDKEYDEWKLRDACDTLLRAEEIKADPKLMKALQPYLDKKVKAYKSVADIRAVAKRKARGE